MGFITNFDSSEIISITREYSGVYVSVDGRKYSYIIFAIWTIIDEWMIDEIQWIEEFPDNMESVVNDINTDFIKNVDVK
jgi:hypothetical protein